MSTLDPINDLLFAREKVALGEARSIRERHGLSRGELADAVGVTTGAISLWERRQRRPHGAKGARFGRVLLELDQRPAIAPEPVDLTGADS